MFGILFFDKKIDFFQLNVLVDTGSTTLAIASYARKDSNIYFHSENSTSIFNSGKEVS